ncbi:ABC transporter ATP-binding protein/permease [Pseudomonas guariconensis]|uniref:ABC transporter ATP-binding protein/permease n=1 Tax=Pseudomonas guariconensis TaxID=1288410 RepID=UPI002363C3EF|nr:ABC transporter ATP-binding protein/permease [Pseudomonas guariconensis]MDD2093083.1 ABC transporter ATP-binding protein/permease [Pseudomonas guariconensis]
MDMNWHQALQESLSWLAIASIITLIGFTAAGALAVRFTRWGRQFWSLAGPYFSFRRSWRPLLVFALLLVLTLFSVRLNVLFSFWYNGFYSALQALDQTAFWYLLGVFAVLATIHVLRSLFTYYVTQAFNIHWRVWLTERLTADWMKGDAYYRGRFLAEPVDNPDQRIELDVNAFVTGSVSLALGAVSALVSLVAFTAILWGLSAPLTLGGVEIPRAMVFAVYLYVIVATWIAFRLGRPLIRLNFLNEKLTANFRYALMRLRENAENIAFYQGAQVERGTLLGRFGALIVNVWALVYRSLKFNGFNLGISQVAVVFPFILQAPRFFSGAIKLGDVMQTSQAFGQVQDSLSFFRESYDTFAQYRATLDRLTGFLDANQQASTLPRVTTQELAQGLDIAGLQVLRPDGHALIADLDLRLRAGQALLIKGPSGSGKTTLLRALAGLWPYAEGEVRRPLGNQALFLSQRPYLPLGDLRTAIAYPAPATAADDARMQQALRQVNLAHLAERLEVSNDWSNILSVGEQQRLAFARLLFNRPQVVFLDESTSAMDEGLEHALYSLLRSEMPDTLLVSVGHRSTLATFHTHRLEMDGQGAWSLLEQQPTQDVLA